MQRVMQDYVIAPALASSGHIAPPLAMRLVAAIPGLNRLPARVIGLGVRREHVETLPA